MKWLNQKRPIHSEKTNKKARTTGLLKIFRFYFYIILIRIFINPEIRKPGNAGLIKTKNKSA
jgi:hypothetical protein